MTSLRPIIWPSLTLENPEDGSQHFAKLRLEFELVEAHLEKNQADAVPRNLFEILRQSYRELGGKIEAEELVEDDDGGGERMGDADQDPIDWLAACSASGSGLSGVPLSTRDVDAGASANLRDLGYIENPALHPNAPGGPYDRTYTVVVSNVETSEPKLGDLRSGVKIAARFIIEKNLGRLPSLKNTDDIKNIQWNKLEISLCSKSGLLIEFSIPEQANEAIARGLQCTGKKPHACAKYKKLCSNCNALGHSVNICIYPARCGKCAKNHATSFCESDFSECAICGGPHTSNACNILVEKDELMEISGKNNCVYKLLWPQKPGSSSKSPREAFEENLNRPNKRAKVEEQENMCKP